MDIFGKKEKALKEQIEALKEERKTLNSKAGDLIELMYSKDIEIKKLQEENEKLRKELEQRDYIAQGIHNILTYNGEPQKKE